MTPHDIDVLIIGAGINGAGLFRDLCEQGVVCTIIDKGDFGSGTSAAPSRLIHGGIKYLETGELRLVAQSTLERNLLLRNAPHCVTPLETVIPIFSWLRGIPAALRTLFGATTAPRSRGAVLIKLGLMMYDFYGRRARVMPRHALWSRARALREIAPLTPRIVAAGTYHDAKVSHPERLVLELLQDGVRACPGSVMLNHATLEGTDGDVVRVRAHDGTAMALRPRIVINAAGPWIDSVNAALGVPTRLIGGTKGSHIVLDHSGLVQALQGRMVYFEADDGRICLVFEHLGRALVGSTDIRADNPDAVRCEGPEVAYFLDALRGLFPGLTFDEGQIVHTYAGIRPLPASDGMATGLISRDHSAPVIGAGDSRRWLVIALVGGKWTTFRGFAEEVADTVLGRLGKARLVSTRDLAIGGGRGFPTDREGWAARLAHETGADVARAALLLNRYGTTAAAILRAEGAAPVALVDAPDHTLQELDWLVRHEGVVHLPDLVLRRTGLAITGRLTLAGLATAAAVAGTALGWDAARRDAEIAATRLLLETRHHMRFGP
ncbi:MAG: glycerol-3-phosphate dehydrogenase/oxidase [Gemmobacter sp.]